MASEQTEKFDVAVQYQPRYRTWCVDLPRFPISNGVETRMFVVDGLMKGLVCECNNALQADRIAAAMNAMYQDEVTPMGRSAAKPEGVREMEAENTRMREALEWYARPHRVESPAKDDCTECKGTGEMWEESHHNGSRYRTKCDCIKNMNAHVNDEYCWDRGKRARAALNPEEPDGR